MKVGIDYISALGQAGNSVYSYNLCNNLAQASDINLYFFHYFHDYIRFRNFKIGGPRVTYVPAYLSSLGNLTLSTFLDKCSSHAVNFFCRTINLDIFHFTNPLNYLNVPSKKIIVTFHDLSYLHNQSWTKKTSGSKMESMMDSIINGASRIIAVSNYTKNDLLKLTGIGADKVEVIYEGVSDEFYPDLDPEFVSRKFKIDGEYILYVGQLQERKNILNLIEAYSLLPVDIRKRCKLALRGQFRDADYESKIKKLISGLNLSDRIIFISDSIDADYLRKLYSNAKFFIYPSFFEGFGLPVVEAMRCGVPVITSENSSLSEVGGDAALYVNPYNPVTIKEAMNRLYYDDDVRSLLKKNAVSQIKKFNWRNTALETFKVYKDALRS